MLSQNIVPSPRTRATVGHHRKATSLPHQICTLSERVTGEERTLIRCSLCRLAATGPVAIRVAGMEMATVAVLASTESRVRVGTINLSWVMAKLESSSNTTTAHTRDVNGQWQEGFDLSYTSDECLAIDCPSPFLRPYIRPQPGCYTPLPP
jgi:hypothetical protein